MTPGRGEAYWAQYLDAGPDLSRFPRDGLVVDVGCGSGDQLQLLRTGGFRPIGLEPNAEQARRCRTRGFLVIRGQAEALPFRTATFDGVLCKVTLPYTDERRALGELARVVRPGGAVLLSSHGVGYSLRYLLWPDSWKHAAYALKTLVNTFVYRVFGRRLPKALGDTVFQSGPRLRAYYRRMGLRLESEVPSRRFAGFPVFIGHVLRK
jgi:ubiquinone/menaquinone biosynthesis C-methylase UbiE